MIDERQNNIRYGDGVEENDSINYFNCTIDCPVVSIVDLYKGVMPPKGRQLANQSIN